MSVMERVVCPGTPVSPHIPTGVKGFRYLGLEYGCLLTNTAKSSPRIQASRAVTVGLCYPILDW